MEDDKIIKIVKINGVRVELEVSRDKASKMPENIESKIRIRNKELERISAGSIFL